MFKNKNLVIFLTDITFVLYGEKNETEHRT